MAIPITQYEAADRAANSWQGVQQIVISGGGFLSHGWRIFVWRMLFMSIADAGIIG